MANNAGKAQFDRTIYGSSGNTGGGGSAPAGVMGSPSQVMSGLRAQGKVPKRNTGRGRRPPARSSRRGR